MSRSSPRLVSSNSAPLRRTGAGQMSPANAFAPNLDQRRGRWPGAARHRVGRLSPRTVTFACPPDREAFMAAWSKFLRLSCGTRGEVARVYDVTFQTACNWWDGSRVPTGDKVGHAHTVAPTLAAQFLSGV